MRLHTVESDDSDDYQHGFKKNDMDIADCTVLSTSGSGSRGGSKNALDISDHTKKDSRWLSTTNHEEKNNSNLISPTRAERKTVCPKTVCPRVA